MVQLPIFSLSSWTSIRLHFEALFSLTSLPPKVILVCKKIAAITRHFSHTSEVKIHDAELRKRGTDLANANI